MIASVFIPLLVPLQWVWISIMLLFYFVYFYCIYGARSHQNISKEFLMQRIYIYDLSKEV
jgi:hypothetical protein